MFIPFKLYINTPRILKKWLVINRGSGPHLYIDGQSNARTIPRYPPRIYSKRSPSDGPFPNQRHVRISLGVLVRTLTRVGVQQQWFSMGLPRHMSTDLWNCSSTGKYRLLTKSSAIWAIRLCKSTRGFWTVTNQGSSGVARSFWVLNSISGFR